jgi:hypothetical protein
MDYNNNLSKRLMRNNLTLRIDLELLKLNLRCGYSFIEEQWMDVHCIGCKYVN